MATGQFRDHIRYVQHTTPQFMNDMQRAYTILAANLQANGLAPHYARSDREFINDPANFGATLQWDDQVAAVSDADVWAGANTLRVLMVNHFGDAEYAHRAVDADDIALLTLTAAPDATDTASASVLLAAMKEAINEHMPDGAFHASTPPSVLEVLVTGTPADAATNKTTYNEMLAVYKRHVFSAVERLSFEAV